MLVLIYFDREPQMFTSINLPQQAPVLATSRLCRKAVPQQAKLCRKAEEIRSEHIRDRPFLCPWLHLFPIFWLLIHET